MTKFTIRALATALCLACLFSFASCSRLLKILADDEEFVPYELTFTSNGDGTCYVSAITINPKCIDKFVLEIPETSPEGDKVTAVVCELFDYNVPYQLSAKDMAEILEQAYDSLGQSDIYSEQKVLDGEAKFGIPDTHVDIMRFNGFYSYMNPNDDDINDASREIMIERYPACVKTPIYVIDEVSKASEREKRLIARFLINRTDYSSFDCLEDYNAIDYTDPDDSVYTPGGEFIREILLPEGVGIDLDFLNSCLGLEKLTVPDGTTRITDHMFSFSSLKEVTIPVSVTDIEQGAFRSCLHLDAINYLGTIDQWNSINNQAKDAIREEYTIICTDGYIPPIEQ